MMKKKAAKKTKTGSRMRFRVSPKAKKAIKKMVKKATKKAIDVSKLRGFARLAALDPDRLKSISAKAGKRAQKLYGHKVRWSKKKARELAPLGGKAAQKKYRAEGHPWRSGSESRVDSSKSRRKGKRAQRRARPAPIEAPVQGVSLAPSDAQPDPAPVTPILSESETAEIVE